MVDSLGSNSGGGGSAKVTHMYLSSSQTISANSNEFVNLDATEESQLSGADTVNHEFVIPSNGTYQIINQAVFDDHAKDNQYDARLRINGSLATFGPSHTGGAATNASVGPGHARVMELTSGDTLELKVQNNAGTSLSLRNASPSTYLNVTKLP